jgi:PAS domain S-box-containing protein
MGLASGRTSAVAETKPGDGWSLLFWIVFARSANPIALLTLDRRCVAVNRAAVTLIGSPRDWIIGRHLETVLVPDEPGSGVAEWRELAQGHGFEAERNVSTPSGERVTVQYAMRRVRLDGRNLVFAVVLDSSLEPIRTRPADSWQAGMLSPRELEIVGQVAMGRRAHEIADDLGIAESTVKTHLRNAMRKVDARSQAQLVALVLGGQLPSAAVPPGTYIGR